MYVRVCVPVHGYVHSSPVTAEADGVRSSETGVPSDCDPHNAGDGIEG